MFTCYTEWEGLREVEMLEKMGAQIVKGLGQNKWRGVILNVHVYLKGTDGGGLPQSTDSGLRVIGMAITDTSFGVGSGTFILSVMLGHLVQLRACPLYPVL